MTESNPQVLTTGKGKNQKPITAVQQLNKLYQRKKMVYPSRATKTEKKEQMGGNWDGETRLAEDRIDNRIDWKERKECGGSWATSIERSGAKTSS